MNWKALALGLGLAALTGALQYAQALPAPWGVLATSALVLVAHLAPSSLGAKKP